MIMTIVLVGDEPREYVEVGDTFTVWMGPRDRDTPAVHLTREAG
jgi:hypothetical protein